VGEAIGAMLPSAIGVAISPLPIVAVILILFSPKARTNGPAFVIGWVVGLAVVVAIVLALADPANLADETDNPSTTASIIQLVFGLLLLFLAYRQFQGRPKEGEEPTMPKWMRAIDKITPVAAFGFGVLMSAINPKNLLLDVAGATSIAQADLSTGSEIVVAIIFILLASVSVGGVLIWYLVAGEGAAAKLNQMKGWLLHNNAVVMAVVLLILGVNLIGKGFGGLTA
jgi:threonine/homoserine/homoserine lactone efflux protein